MVSKCATGHLTQQQTAETLRLTKMRSFSNPPLLSGSFCGGLSAWQTSDTPTGPRLRRCSRSSPTGSTRGARRAVVGRTNPTIKPQRRQRRIDDLTEYTAADIWLADESETVGLVWLSESQPRGITVYDGETEWRLLASPAEGPWRPLGLVPEGRLPLRYCTRLPYGRRPLKGQVAADGTWSVWLLEDE